MGDHSFFKIPKNKSLKDVTKVYKSLVSKRHHDKKNPEETSPGFEYNDNKRVDEDIWSRKFLSKAASRRSKTPTPKSRPLSRHGSRRCTTPTSLSRSISRKSAAEIAASSIKRIMSRRSSSTSFPRSMRLDISEPELCNPAGSPTIGAGIRGSSTFSRNMRSETSEPELCNPSGSPTKGAGAGIRSAKEREHVPPVSLSSNLSRRATTPIIFSQTTARRKPPEVERVLHCTLENLCFGCIKKIKLTRDVIKHPGVIVQEEEVLKIEVKPGWRKGTKITFEGVGDEKPGYLPADIVFLIDEKQHPLFTRDGNDLEICVEIPLVDALTGCSISIPLLGGENMTLSFKNIVIYPGYEKIIKGQGMPNPKNNGIRGDLHVKFLVDFPTELSEEQRKEASNILQGCC
ncbi:protein psi1 [Cajanus cajan]|uniref:protein psi1 n=1 Tax=Cajanus cajan TaxID=3821 RepID=UPI00098D86C2|nr:protein psi1 [Cajanus cajan]